MYYSLEILQWQSLKCWGMCKALLYAVNVLLLQSLLWATYFVIYSQVLLLKVEIIVLLKYFHFLYFEKYRSQFDMLHSKFLPNLHFFLFVPTYSLLPKWCATNRTLLTLIRGSHTPMFYYISWIQPTWYQTWFPFINCKVEHVVLVSQLLRLRSK